MRKNMSKGQIKRKKRDGCINSLSARKKMSKVHRKNGKLASNWQGGISGEPYVWNWNIIREKIYKRDKYKCQLCGKTEKDLVGYYKKLTAHHIDYNKKNCKESNLITLCNRCNLRVNGSRDYWFAYFTYIMEKR